MERGLIITRPFGITKEGGCIFGGGITPENLRFYLLYWDKLDLPLTPTVDIGLDKGLYTDELLFLKSAGILNRSVLNVGKPGLITPDLPLLLQSEALIKNNSKQPGCWSIAQKGGLLNLPTQSSEVKESIEFLLYNAIPITIPSVPLDEILSFKERRRDELKRFRQKMDSLYLKVVQSADIPRSKITTIEELESAISNLNRVFDEQWKEKLLATIKVELNIPSLAAGGIAGAAMGTLFGINTELGAAIGSALSAIKFDFSYSRVPQNIPNDLLDYAYLHNISSELPKSPG